MEAGLGTVAQVPEEELPWGQGRHRSEDWTRVVTVMVGEANQQVGSGWVQAFVVCWCLWRRVEEFGHSGFCVELWNGLHLAGEPNGDHSVSKSQPGVPITPCQRAGPESQQGRHPP